MIKENRANELEDFKTNIDLRQVAASMGYQEDRQSSDRNHTVMRNGGHKIIVGVAQGSGHWVYSDNQANHGSIIDLVQAVEGGSLGDVRKRLREFTGATVEQYTRPKPVPTPADVTRVKAEWQAAAPVHSNGFLDSRGIPPDVYTRDPFVGTWRQDSRKNAVFPYFSAGQMVGCERRNQPAPGGDKSFRAYSKGGRPGVWMSSTSSEDRELVIVESPIDAMALHALDPRPGRRYVAVRQGVTEDDLRSVIRGMPAGATIVAATDADAAGDKYAAMIEAAAEGYVYKRGRPPEGQDWNDVLVKNQEEENARSSICSTLYIK